MANGILRKITVGIAKESSYGSTAASPTFVLPVTELSWEEVANKVENPAMIGSTYMANNVFLANKYINFSMTFKLDEDIFPLLLLQKYSIVSGTHAGESAVYDHTATYSNTNVGTSFTLFWSDPDRDDISASGCKFDTINLIATTNNFVMVEVSGRGLFPADDTFTNTVTGPREFVGKHVDFKIDDQGGTPASIEVLSLNINHSFSLSGDDVNIPLNSLAPTNLFTTADRFELETSFLFPDNTYKDKWGANTAQESSVVITDTAREVSGAVAGTNPSVTFTYPYQHITNWTREGGADELLRQAMTLLALDYIGESTAPEEIVVTNSVASY